MVVKGMNSFIDYVKWWEDVLSFLCPHKIGVLLITPSLECGTS